MRLQIGRIDHDCLQIGALGGQADDDPGEDDVIAPTLPAIIKRLGRSIFPRRIASSQATAIDEDNAAQRPQIFNARTGMALGEVGAKT
jgi:hypothetical protein